MKPLALALSGLALTSLLVAARPSRTAAGDPTLADLSWLAGHWVVEQQGTRTEEVWLAPGGGFMLGMNREARANGKGSFEFLRIEPRADGLVYVASPGGKGATEFPLADVGEGFVQFENPAHDFPQRIRYELTKDGLHARVSGGEGAQEQVLEWTWKRAEAKGAAK